MKGIEKSVKREDLSQIGAFNPANEPHRYSGHVRLDDASFAPENANRAIEIRCGAGHALARLKANKGCVWVAGVEVFYDAANQARTRLDEVYDGDIEKLELPLVEESFKSHFVSIEF